MTDQANLLAVAGGPAWPPYLVDTLRCALIALAIGLPLQPLVLWAMTAGAVIDAPTARSSHTTATPRGGGLASVVAAAATLLLYRSAWLVVVPLLLYAAIGLAEDVRGVPVPARLASQLTAGVVSAVVLLPQAHLGPLAITVIALWLTGFANAFNFMDGVNGLATVHAVLAGLVFAVLGLRYDVATLVVAGAVVAAAAATFLPWNAGRARIFLGDVGSYGLGAVLGALAAYALVRGVPIEAAVAPLALHLADTGWTLARRAWRGEAWYRPHRSHAYQRLTDVGWSHQRVTAVTATISGGLCVLALAVPRGEPLLRTAFAGVAIAILAGYLAAPSWLAARQSGRPRTPSSVQV